MSGWFTAWWSFGSTSKPVGPARNLPVTENIKKFFDQKPVQVITISSEEMGQALKNLRDSKSKTIVHNSDEYKHPLTIEIETIFSNGVKGFFEQNKARRLGLLQKAVETVETVVSTDSTASVETTDSAASVETTDSAASTAPTENTVSPDPVNSTEKIESVSTIFLCVPDCTSENVQNKSAELVSVTVDVDTKISVGFETEEQIKEQINDFYQL